MKIKKVRPTFRKRISEIAYQQAVIDKARIRSSLINRILDWFRPGYTQHKLDKYDARTAESIASITKRVSHGAVERE